MSSANKSESDSIEPVMLRPCTCEGWQEYIPILQGQQVFANNHFAADDYPDGGTFIYCPFCGEKRKAT